MDDKPKASSTPKIVDVTRRRAIGNFKESLQSPIIYENIETYNGKVRDCGSKKFVDNEITSCSVDCRNTPESCDISNSEEEDYSAHISKNKSFDNYLILCVITSVVIIFAICFLYYSVEDNGSFTELSKKFPSQVEDFWLSLDVAVNDIKTLQQPKTFLFIYEDRSEKITNNILFKVAEKAVCHLTNCSQHPVVLDSSDLNSPDILKDYGKIIDINRKELEENGVMIVRNLERVSGETAQAFHSLCDEYNPVVKKALFLFTVKVDRLYETNNLKYVEKFLQKQWNDLHEDKFFPLFTRISNFVFPITVD